jgi:hypothetical protein
VVAIPALAVALGWQLRGIRFPSAAKVTSRRVIALQSAANPGTALRNIRVS